MLLELTVGNFKSIAEPVTLSMVATNDQTHLDYIFDVGAYRILPSALIVGPNGAGKSNLFQALRYLVRLVQGTTPMTLPYFPHIKGEQQPTRLRLQLLINQIRYAYVIEWTNMQIVEEYLIRIEDVEEEIFYRNSTTVSINNRHYPIEKTALALTSIKEKKLINKMEPVIYYIQNQIYFDLPELGDEVKELEKAEQRFNELNDPSLVTNLFRHLNTGIEDIRMQNNHLHVVYAQMALPFKHESTGMKRLLKLLILIQEALEDGKLLIIDELERNLHVELASIIIKLFNQTRTNPMQSQLIFSSHNTHLLNLALFRQDQIWFVEKNINTMATDLYSLYNFEDVMIDEDIEYGYVQGKYGATFQINLDEVGRDE